MKIRPARRARGTVEMPGDKSISHRAAMIAALASGETTIRNFSTSADCASTLYCLEQLGVSIARDGNTIRIGGIGLEENLCAPQNALDCGNSGTTMRLLAGILAGQNFTSTLVGDESLSRRPMRRIIAPLGLMGAQISSREGCAPLKIKGRRPLRAVSYQTPVASAQVKSCVLLAGLFSDGRTEIIERTKTRDHTERMLRWFGVAVDEKEARFDDDATQDDEKRKDFDKAASHDQGQEIFDDGAKHLVSIAPPFKLSARDFSVPGDISSATFFIAAASLLPDSSLIIRRVGLNPTRAQILATLRSLGAEIEVKDAREESNEPVGDIEVCSANFADGTHGANETRGANSNNSTRQILRGASVAILIDELPMLAVIGTQLANGLEIRDAAELRVKESDRIRTVVENLRAMGAEVEEHTDGMTIAGRTKLRGARIETHGDHRIAMAFSIAALIAEGESEIVGADSVAVSFPNFFELLASVTEQ